VATNGYFYPAKQVDRFLQKIPGRW